MTRDRIEKTLDRMGSMDIPGTDELTVARIESHWRSAVAGSRQMRGAVITGPGGPARRRSAVLASAGVLAVAAAASALVAFNLDREQPTRVVVANAEDIVILLPSGRFVDPHPGETLPEGAFVQAGPYADGRIGDRLVRPDDLYVVADGRLQNAKVEQLEAATPDSSVETAPPSTASMTTRRRASTVVPAPEAPPEPTEAPPSSLVTPDDESANPNALSGQDAPTTAPSRRDGALRVRAKQNGGSVVVRWKKAAGPRVRRYVVFRVDSWDGGGMPASGPLASIGESSATSFVDDAPQAGTMYVVAVVGEDDQLLAIGSAASPFTGDADPDQVVVETTEAVG